jgi:hypothetical protein
MGNNEMLIRAENITSNKLFNEAHHSLSRPQNKGSTFSFLLDSARSWGGGGILFRINYFDRTGKGVLDLASS